MTQNDLEWFLKLPNRTGSDRIGSDRIGSDCSFRLADFTWSGTDLVFGFRQKFKRVFPIFFRFFFDLSGSPDLEQPQNANVIERSS